MYIHEDTYKTLLMNIKNLKGMTWLFLDLEILTLKAFNYHQFNTFYFYFFHFTLNLYFLSSLGWQQNWGGFFINPLLPHMHSLPRYQSGTFVTTDKLKIWNTSRICMSSLCRGHANLLYIVPIFLVYVLLKRAL